MTLAAAAPRIFDWNSVVDTFSPPCPKHHYSISIDISGLLAVVWKGSALSLVVVMEPKKAMTPHLLIGVAAIDPKCAKSYCLSDLPP
ncbi:hypothetical protein GUJ93_ZPchr0010g7850 [Zizania palustris]|uniref:Uncharacterized protein n=1 Tax=Zizania palustris TaxID=103762 RepID=A0A8J5SZD0_ZIZPA|nr:hypothetical protein GUJ93_ZPchr0010g7850 [Zizania palustris]